MITRFEKLKVGDKFVSFYHGKNTQDAVGETIWTKTTESLAFDKEGGPKKFDKMDSVYKLKKVSIPPIPEHIGGEA